MSIHDHRSKPETMWTYYVVDHLPTMANIHRFDTVDEAIQCYRALDPHLRSAIGSSIGCVHELDLIHRCVNDTPVLVTAYDQIETPLWRESTEIQSSIDRMITELGVQYQRNNTLFPTFPSVLVPLERHTPDSLDSYFCRSILLPDVPGQYASAVTEAFVAGEGWMKREDFFRMLRNSTSGAQGMTPRDPFLERLNIRYIDLQTGYIGEADISPQQLELLTERTKCLLSPEMLDADMDMLLNAYLYNKPLTDTTVPNITASSDRLEPWTLRHYRDIVKYIAADTKTSASIHDAAKNLQRRLLALTPREFHRSALETQIAAAETSHQTAPWAQSVLPPRDEVR